MSEKKKIPPREVPDRDSKYMGLAWIQASFSKDPSTQVGAVIVTDSNDPLGSGYNGPPCKIDDHAFSWDRPPKDNPGAFSKYDVMVHAEANAIDHSDQDRLAESTLYVTALPCPSCMKEIVRKEIRRVVYMDYQSSSTSSLQNAEWREKSLEIARLGGVNLQQFQGNIYWLLDWTQKMKDLGVFKMG